MAYKLVKPGVEYQAGDDLVYAVHNIPHMLIAGVSGVGKSWFQHALVQSLLASDQVGHVHGVDFKDGIEFTRYARHPKMRVTWRFEDMIALGDELMQLSHERGTLMREQGQQNWTGPRIFLVIDEFAEIQSMVDTADKETKAEGKRLISNL